MPKRSIRLPATRRRVLLVCAQPLLGEGLGAILSALKDVELIGPLDPEPNWLERLPPNRPDVVVIADDGGANQNTTSLTADVLDRFPDAPVIRVGLEKDALRLYTSQTLPARSADLIEAIRSLPAALRPSEAQGVQRAPAGASPRRRST